MRLLALLPPQAETSDRLQHLEPKLVSKFVDRLPFVCDGRVQLSSDIKQVGKDVCISR